MTPLTTRLAALAATLAGLAGCNLHDALFGFPEPAVAVLGRTPVELAYREAPGGIVILRGRVNDKADVDFILDTGAPVTVLLEGERTAALGLDTSGARPLGDPANPATPTGVIQPGFRIDFGGVSFSGLTAVVVPAKTMPCPERFAAIGFGGVIGADLFRRFVVEVDTARKVVRLHDPKSWRLPEGGTVVPIALQGRHPFVEAKLTLADGREIASRMNVDTGSNGTLTLAAGSPPALPMPRDGEVRRSCLVNGVREDRLGPPVTVTLGGVKVPVEAPVYSEALNPVDGTRTGTIGAGFFQGRRFYIDYPGSRIVLG